MDETSFLIDVMMPMAQAAYSVMAVPAPPLMLPAGYQMATTIHANPPKAANATQAATPDMQRLAQLTVVESSIFGLIGWNAATKTAVVSIRGTQTLNEWLKDFDAPLVPDRSVPNAGLVHMGFQLVYEQIRDSILDGLAANCVGATTIYVTGHSLGAALAILCGIDLVANGRGVTPEVYTFAGPRTGDQKFAGYCDAAIPVCRRVVNFMDMVPQVPTPPLYLHVGSEILVHGGFRPLDIAYAHHLTTYLAGLQKLLPAAQAMPLEAPPPPQPEVGVEVH